MSAGEDLAVAFRGRLGGFTLEAGFSGPARGVTALFGPSGCGKTTLLRCIAGLQRLEGTCRIGRETWQDERGFRPTWQRPIGFVFQEASLFPHLSVRQNLLYGRRTRRGDRPAGVQWEEIVDLLMLAPLLDRATDRLSGGERQRVAIGRALLTDPKLVLMDEPLSALDRGAKDEVLTLLEALRDRLTLPIVYVSHDIAEVERLADRLVLMRGGRVIAAGPLSVLQSDPALPLASGRDAAVTLDGIVESVDPSYGLLTIGVGTERLVVPAPTVAVGTARRLRIAAADVSLSREAGGPSTILNVLRVRVVALSHPTAHEVLAVLALGPDAQGPRLLARVTRLSAERLGLREGFEAFAQVKSVALARRDEPAVPLAQQ